jgi:hypothetical protein
LGDFFFIYELEINAMKKAASNIISIATILLVSGCASEPQTAESDPAYISPAQYKDYDCKQIGAEMRRVSKKIDVATQTDGTTQVLNAAVTAFAISRGMGVSGDDGVQMRRLKNQYDVLEETAIQKKCNL